VTAIGLVVGRAAEDGRKRTGQRFPVGPGRPVEVRRQARAVAHGDHHVLCQVDAVAWCGGIHDGSSAGASGLRGPMASQQAGATTYSRATMRKIVFQPSAVGMLSTLCACNTTPISSPPTNPPSEPAVFTRAKTVAAFRPPRSVVAPHSAGCSQSLKNLTTRKTAARTTAFSRLRTDNINIAATSFPAIP